MSSPRESTDSEDKEGPRLNPLAFQLFGYWIKEEKHVQELE